MTDDGYDLDVLIRDIESSRDGTTLNTNYKAAYRVLMDAGVRPFAHRSPCRRLDDAYRIWWTVRTHTDSIVIAEDEEGHMKVRHVGRAKATAAPRRAMHERLAHPNDDGTITCTGPCGETKPANKFPTVKGGIGRESRCRTCRDNKGGDNG